MGIGADAPNAPSYDPMLKASLGAYNSDLAASENLYGLGLSQIGFGNQLTGTSADVGQQMRTAMQEAHDWGREQFNTIWPYAKDYLSSQGALSKLAGENASESIIAAREGRQRAADTYARYQSEFAPAEDRFVQEAMDYNSPARAAQASGRAQSDVAATFAQQRRAEELRQAALGQDPTQGISKGANTIYATQQAAAQAGAGTQARERSYATGLDLVGKAASMGTGLSAQALAELQAAAGGASSGIQAGAAGAGGIGAATSALTAGTTAGGSPVAYGYMSNPYTALAGTTLGSASNMYNYGTSALGNLTGVINAASGAQNNEFSNRMSEFNAEQKSQTDAWGGIFKGLGMAGSVLGAPVPGAGTIGGAILSGLPFSDRRLKEDIKPIGRLGALTMYSFHYKGSPALQVGYMADEVERVDPSAVHMNPSGYKSVDYGRATISALGA